MGAKPGELMRDRNPNWRGGRSLASNGYVLVRVGVGHHLADVRGYAYEHRVVAEKKAGRRLHQGELVHHLDGNKSNNDPANLEIVSGAAEHFLHHRQPRAERLRLPHEDNPTVRCSCGCGLWFGKFDSTGRPRRFVSGHNAHPSPTLDAIRAVLAMGDVTDRAHIVRLTGKSGRIVGTALNRLRIYGEVESAGRGKWRMVSAQQEAA